MPRLTPSNDQEAPDRFDPVATFPGSWAIVHR